MLSILGTNSKSYKCNYWINYLIMICIFFALAFLSIDVVQADEDNLESASNNVSDFLASNKIVLPPEVNIVYHCNFSANIIVNNGCGRLSVAIRKTEEVSDVTFIPVSEATPQALNFLFVASEQPKLETEVKRIATHYSKIEISSGCEVFSFSVNDEELMMFFMRENVDVDVCVRKSVLYYLGFRRLDKLKTAGSLEEVFKKIF